MAQHIPHNETKVFLGCLPGDTNAEELSSYFSKFCITPPKMKIKYRKNRICSGYGDFKAVIDKESLDAMLNTNHYYKERSIECRVYLKGKDLREYQERSNRKRVHVGNLSPDLTDKQLYEAFSLHGDVKRAYIANSLDTDGCCFGFVTFERKEDADLALSLKALMIGDRQAEINPLKSQNEGVHKKKNIFGKGLGKIRGDGLKNRSGKSQKYKICLNKFYGNFKQTHYQHGWNHAARGDPQTELCRANGNGVILYQKNHAQKSKAFHGRRRDQSFRPNSKAKFRGWICLKGGRIPKLATCVDKYNIRINKCER